jgi:hypothetical protein
MPMGPTATKRLVAPVRIIGSDYRASLHKPRSDLSGGVQIGHSDEVQLCLGFFAP